MCDSLCACLRFIFWKLGGHVTTQLGIQSVLGALYASVTFLCIINSIILQPIVAENRAVMYRERAAGELAVHPSTLLPFSARCTLFEVPTMLGSLQLLRGQLSVCCTA